MLLLVVVITSSEDVLALGFFTCRSRPVEVSAGKSFPRIRANRPGRWFVTL